jgi:hypothetical protein
VSVEVEVTPAETEQLTLPQTRHRRHQVERPLERAGRRLRGNAPLDHRGQLLLGQVADIGCRLRRRQVDERTRVLTNPAPPYGEREQRVQRARDIPDCLRRQTSPAQACKQAIHIVLGQSIDGALTENRNKMDP